VTKGRVLVTITGADHPGITATVARILAETQVTLLDIEQVVVQGNLTLCLLLGFDDPAAYTQPVLKDLLFEGKSLGINVDFKVMPPTSETVSATTDYVITLISSRVNAAHLRAVATRLAQWNANIEHIQRLTEEHLAAVEILFSLPAQVDASELKKALLAVSTEQGCDIAIQRNDIYRRSKRLVAMDMDSTLIRIEVIDELARIAGVGEQVAAITRRAMAGEMDYDESLRQRVALLKGLDAGALEQIAQTLPLTEGAETLIRVLKKLGYRTAVISGGFNVPALALKEKLGLDYAHSNVLEVQDGKLTGRVSGGIVNAQRKADLLEALAQQERISLDQTVAIGDGANDLLMIQRAGLGIAFHAKAKLREAADTSLSGGLDSVLYLLGITARDLRDVR
jgi:phosphoserine phosphatase